MSIGRAPKTGGFAMAVAEVLSGPIPESTRRIHLRRAVIASTVGTTIEWYDFLLYGQVASIVFAKLFFPRSAPLVGTLEAFGIYFVGFVARPIGAAIFGHYGDRIGRKAALIATLLLTGLSTFAVGLVPTYEQIGIWAAVILIVLRLIQGIGVGGEWGGSVLLAMEWARTNKHRGFIAAWPQFGGPAGLFLANLAVLAFSAISGDEFITWGWRVPFYLSLIMVAIGLYIRLGILETPVFSELAAAKRLERVPTIEVFKRQPKAVILAALARSVEQGPAYIYFSFVFVYGSMVLHVSRDLLLGALLLASCIDFLLIPVTGYISDRYGRKRTFMIAAAVAGLYGFPYYALMDTALPSLIVLATVLAFVFHAFVYGPQGALIAECFTPRLRYSGTSLGYQLASITAGGPAPLVATALLAKFGSGWPIAGYILFYGVVSFVATALLPDFTNRDISEGRHGV
jgi:MFS family permease